MDEMKLKSPATIMFAGATSSGKSSTAAKLLRYSMFDVAPKNIFYVYGVWSPQYDAIASASTVGKHIEFVHGLPSNFDRFFSPSGEHNLLILDDVQVSVVLACR